MSIGKLCEFDTKCGVWSSYVDRLRMYYKVNKIADDMKLPILIASIGDEAYELLVNLSSPTNPADLTFDQAVKYMSQHLQPAPSALTERYRFRQRRQLAGENIASYVAELRRLSRYCKFGNMLNENLRDQFVCGIKSDIIRQRLFAEKDDVTLVEAVKVATALEAAERDAAAVDTRDARESAGSGAGGEASAVHALAPAASGARLGRAVGGAAGSARGGRQRGGGGASSGRASLQRADGAPQYNNSFCGACGARNHDYGSCRYRNFICSKCQRTGHLRRVCPEWRAAAGGRLHFGQAQGDEEEADEGAVEYDMEQELNHLCLNDYRPVSVSVHIDNKLISMEIDTGTAISCISRATFDKYFSKIDLSQAYNQIELDESKRYTVINTHRGLFQYNRLVYGLASSVGIFQRIMIQLFKGIPNVQVFLDDVIIGGKSEKEHMQALEMVFQRLKDSGLKLKKSKCVFLAQEITYLGYVVSKEGIKADKSKIEAILQMQPPTNLTELRSFLGMVNFFAKFIKNISSMLAPLYNLLRKKVEWHWTADCERAFRRVKEMLTSAEILSHYEPSRAVVLTCDASARGVGAVLAQPGGDARGERPVAYASRTLTDAEKNYSQIHREALAIIFGLKKFHQYLYGRRFTLRTDHKPLVSIFGPNNGIPQMTASRMQRWAIILSAYDYEIEYVKTDDNCADGLSRLPRKGPAENVTLPEQTYLHFAQDALMLDYNDVKRMTIKDGMLSRVLSYVRDGWPAECELTNLKPYFNRKQELYEELGCLMWGHRVVIPEGCRAKVLDMIHEPHMGIVKSKALARSYVWWPGADEAVEAACRACAVCAAHADQPPRHAPRAWPWPARPWTRLHLDFMGPIGGKTYLIVLDAMSKWLEVFVVPSTAANFSINVLTELFSRFGLPRQLVTDNGPPFTSREFEEYLNTNIIEHIFTAPYHPASNGAAENSVKTIKRVVKKAISEGKSALESIHTFLMYYRNTEHCSTGESPSMLLMNRRLRTRLDALKPDRGQKALAAQRKQTEAAGGGFRSVDPGDQVWYRQYLQGEKWRPGTVSQQLGKTNFKIVDNQGKEVHRHIDQLKRRCIRSSLVCPKSPKNNIREPEDVSQGSEVRPEGSALARGRNESEQDTGLGQPPPHRSPAPAAASPELPQAHPERLIRQCRLDNPPKYKV